MSNRATVYLFCGLPCSGKSSLARRLEQEKHVLRLTLDEWMISLFDFTIDQPEYAVAAQRVRSLIWDIAKQAISNGVDVALDWSLWNPELRGEWKEKVQGVGARYVIYYLDVTLEEVVKRLQHRNSTKPKFTHLIDSQEVIRFSKVFIAPLPDEKLELKVIRDPLLHRL